MSRKTNSAAPIPAYSLSDLKKMAQHPSGSPQDLNVKEYLQRNQLLHASITPGLSFYFMIDYTSLSYFYMSSTVWNITGYTSEDWIKAGMAFVFQTYHPDDAATQKAIHEKVFAFQRSVPVAEQPQYRYSHDFRIRRADDTYIRLMQQSIFLEVDEAGRPLLDLCVCTDITSYKKDTTQVLNISRYDPEQGLHTVLLEHFPVIPKTLISAREADVLQLLGKGYSSQQIADQLCLSKYTIDTHRKNLLEKTGVQNTSELIQFGLGNGLL